MAEILETSTELEIVGSSFTLVTQYSGETNPNIEFDATFSVTDGVDPINNVEIDINGDLYYTGINGEVVINLIRGDYTANISKSGYHDQVSNFTILDQDIIKNIVMIQIGSFDDSYDDSYDNN